MPVANNRSGWRRLLALGVLAGTVSITLAAPAANSDAEADAGIVRELQNSLVRSFELAPKLTIDADLRNQANAIAISHLARVNALLPVWIAEERTAQAAGGAKPAASDVYFAVWARLLNELALWQIMPGDAAYERAVLDTAAHAPASCAMRDDYRFTDYSSRIMRLQSMAPAVRQAALASERALLEQWGKPRRDVPPLPEPLPQELGMAAIARMQAGGTPPPAALPPVLASRLLAERGDYAAQPWETKCLFQQWWLRVSLANGMAPATALAAFRYGTMLTADERMGNWFSARDMEEAKLPGSGAGTGMYPPLARRFQVTGATTITRSQDAAGKFKDSRLSARTVDVPGIRGVRAVAFETVFDKIAISQSLQPNVGTTAFAPPLYRMVWNFNSPAAAPAKGEK
jgi:hypothetical protein